MSINYFIPNLRASPNEISQKTLAANERKFLEEKAKESLEQEFLEYTQIISRTPHHEGMIRLKKLHNSLYFSNSKKQQTIKDLINAISNIETQRTKSCTNFSLSSPRFTFSSSNLETQESVLSDLKEQIKSIEKSTEQEEFLNDQLQQMKSKEKSEIALIKKKTLETQEFYKSISRFENSVENLKIKADIDKAQAIGNCAITKKDVERSRKSRNQALQRFKKREISLAENIKAIQGKIVEDQLNLNENQMKKSDIVKNLEIAVGEYESKKALNNETLGEMNLFFEGIETLKKIIKRSKTVVAEGGEIEFDDIFKYFSRFQVMESHLQVKYSNLTLAHSVLEENINRLNKELKEIRGQELVSDRIRQIKVYANNLKLENATYSGLRVNVETKQNFDQEAYEANENLAVFTVKFIIEISNRISIQLELVRKFVENHPHLLKMYLSNISKILLALQQGSIVKLNKKHKSSLNPKDVPVRRQVTSKTINLKHQDIPFDSRFTFEKFKSFTQSELVTIFLKEYPKSTKSANQFSKFISTNTITRLFISQTDMAKHFRVSKIRDPHSESITNHLKSLYLVSNKNLKKITVMGIEIIMELLKKINHCSVDIKRIIDSQKFDSTETSDLIKKYELELKDRLSINDTQELVKSLFHQKLKFLDEQKQMGWVGQDKVMHQFTVIENSPKEKKSQEDIINSEALSSVESFSSHESSLKEELVQKRQVKYKSPTQITKSLPRINNKKELFEEIKAIQTGINIVKKGELQELKEFNNSEESSPSNENLPLIVSPKGNSMSKRVS